MAPRRLIRELRGRIPSYVLQPRHGRMSTTRCSQKQACLPWTTTLSCSSRVCAWGPTDEKQMVVLGLRVVLGRPASVPVSGLYWWARSPRALCFFCRPSVRVLPCRRHASSRASNDARAFARDHSVFISVLRSGALASSGSVESTIRVLDVFFVGPCHIDGG